MGELIGGLSLIRKESTDHSDPQFKLNLNSMERSGSPNKINENLDRIHEIDSEHETIF
jgi:hypothetical protein